MSRKNNQCNVNETSPAVSAVENNLAMWRRRRGISAAALASRAGVSRQTIYAIEAGTYVPNTVVALKLAKLLDTSLENIFSLSKDAVVAPARSLRVTLLPGSGPLEPGQHVQLCPVGQTLVASPPSIVPWYVPLSDAVLTDKPSARTKTKVALYHADEDFRNRILIAGCDPGVSVLARYLQPAGIDLVLAHRNSSESLQLLKAGYVHVAGTHLRDRASGESNIPRISQTFAKNAVSVFSFATWEEGIVTAKGNPKQIRSIADFGRSGVSIVNREPGAGSRALLDASLNDLGLKPRQVLGYDNMAKGHLAAAWYVHSGVADACLATRAAAQAFGLAFLPLVATRYDLVIRRQHVELRGVQELLNTLGRSSFRRDLESLGGYDTAVAGQHVL